MATTETPTSPASPDQPPVAVRVPTQKILLELDVHRTGAVPVQVSLQKLVGLTDTVFHRQTAKRPVAPARASSTTPSEWWDRCCEGSSRRLPAVGGVGDSEEPGDVGVPLPSPGQQCEPSSRRSGISSPPVMGRMPRLLASRRELQGAAQRFVSVSARAW